MNLSARHLRGATPLGDIAIRIGGRTSRDRSYRRRLREADDHHSVKISEQVSKWAAPWSFSLASDAKDNVFLDPKPSMLANRLFSTSNDIREFARETWNKFSGNPEGIASVTATKCAALPEKIV